MTMINRLIQTPIMHCVVEKDGLVFIAGTTADDVSVGMRGQTEQILAKFDRFLKEAGTDKSRLLSVSIFITEFDQKPEMDAAWKAWLAPEEFPTRATVGVANLGKGTLIEMIATAAK
jgi:2-iminobutanoate/2-iminopropanoate deaminase